MENNNLQAPASSMELSDIYYILFRHKWKILLCSLAGFAAAFTFYKLFPPPFQSEAKLFIRYVMTVEGKSGAGPGREDGVAKSPDSTGGNIINSELEVLTSLDLAQQVAESIGPEKILAKIGKGKELMSAAVAVRTGLIVEVPTKTNVVRVVFQHPDAEIVQPVLRELVNSYLKKHVEIHRAIGFIGDFLAQETDQLRSRLAQTEEELRKTMNKAGILSLEDSKRVTGEQLSRLREAMFDVQAELAQRTSILEAMTKGKAATPAAAAEPATPPVPKEKIEAYQKVSSRSDLLHKREQDALTQFTEESPRVKEIRVQIAEADEQKKQLETDFPMLTKLRVNAPAAGQPTTEFDPVVAGMQITALNAKFAMLKTQVDDVRADAVKVDQLENQILDLRRRKELEEANYRYYSASLEQSRINEALGTGRVSNISEIQTPTPPVKDWKKTYQIIAGIGASGIVVGLMWAFAIELLFDRSVRRPIDIERNLRLPLFLSIPRISQNGRFRLPFRKSAGKKLLQAPADANAKPPEGGNGHLVPVPASVALMPGGSDPALNPFYETLRDRLISYFESINLRHKPKLVAMTGLGRGTGVTTIAAGLARSFSETGEGNVLLVDMTQGQGSAQYFHKGAPVCGLDQVLDTKADAQVQANLYVVGETSSSERLAKGIPQRFTQLVPKLKASDFDYIIFDMPPVNQISITPRLASFMDMVLMVIESEKTDRDTAARAAELLEKSKTQVGVILNKAKMYIPGRLHQDHEFLLGG